MSSYCRRFTESQQVAEKGDYAKSFRTFCVPVIFNVPLGHLIRDIANLTTCSYAVEYNRDILIINLYDETQNYDQAARMALVDSVIGNLSVAYGISNPFSALGELPVTFEQASHAVKIGTQY